MNMIMRRWQSLAKCANEHAARRFMRMVEEPVAKALSLSGCEGSNPFLRIIVQKVILEVSEPKVLMW